MSAMAEEPPPEHTTPPECSGDDWVRPGSKNTEVQLVISSVLGLSAFIAFCFLRPRWKSLYQARKRSLDPRVNLPSMPDTFLGWIPVLYKVTDEQVLQAAGLDAYVFLKFFKVSIRLFSVMLFFALTVLWPINQHYWKDYVDGAPPDNGTNPDDSSLYSDFFSPPQVSFEDDDLSKRRQMKDRTFLWAYLVFTWFFSFLVIYYINSETFRVNKVRQEYLGSQTTIADRTFRVTGIPKDLRSEARIKNLVERLEIGHVENVTLCYDWTELDRLMEKRKQVLHKLEVAWATYINQKPKKQPKPQPIIPDAPPPGEYHDDNGDDDGDIEAYPDETGPLLPSSNNNIANNGATDDDEDVNGDNELTTRGPRPLIRVHHGFLLLRSTLVDSIDHHTDLLAALDTRILLARQKKYTPADLAFVTMDSTASSQMAIQALLHPVPGQLLTKPAPAPTDVVWKNTYKSRVVRRLRSWSVTLFVSVLSVLWLLPVASLASLLSICTIRTLFPGFAATLDNHEIARALVQTGLPTVVVSLLNIAVPYLYEWLSYHQAQISVGDVELSIVSKNFFFTFFNIFLVFAISGTATQFWAILRKVATDTTAFPRILATQIIDLNHFYLNFIMLQAIGLFPFKLLDFGNAALFPLWDALAKTPREKAEVRKPSTFSYGFYLPTALLVFILCIVYSILPMTHLVLSLGLAYFVLGYGVFKYQLCYGMEQPQHATGGAWRIICYRVLLGLTVFQCVMSGILALEGSYEQSVLVAPLVVATVWYSVYWRRRFEPLTRFIALKSVRLGDAAEGGGELGDQGIWEGEGVEEEETGQLHPREIFRRGSTVDEEREKGVRFVNPNLVSRLEQPWIYKDPPPPNSSTESSSSSDDATPHPPPRPAARPMDSSGSVDSAASEFSLGDTHIWRQTTMGSNMV